MATKTPQNEKAAPAAKPSAEMVTRIACALLKSPGYALATREEQHLDRLVTNSVKIATKIITALEA